MIHQLDITKAVIKIKHHFNFSQDREILIGLKND